MNVQKPGAGSDPEGTVPVAKNGAPLWLSGKTWKRIGLPAIPDHRADAPPCGDDHRAPRALAQGLQLPYRLGNRIRGRWRGLPAPHPIATGRPKHAVALLVHADDGAAEASVAAVALGRSGADCAQQPGVRRRRRTHPERALAVLVKRMDDAAVQLRVGQEFSAVPGHDPAGG